MKPLTFPQACRLLQGTEQLVTGMRQGDERAFSTARQILHAVADAEDTLPLYACFEGGLEKLVTFAMDMAKR